MIHHYSLTYVKVVWAKRVPADGAMWCVMDVVLWIRVKYFQVLGKGRVCFGEGNFTVTETHSGVLFFGENGDRTSCDRVCSNARGCRDSPFGVHCDKD